MEGVFIIDENRMWVETLWEPLNEKNNSLLGGSESEIGVAAYCRVSPGHSKDIHSLLNQISYFTLLIRSKPNWKFAGIYFDNGISGANHRNRSGFKRLLRHAKEGSIDYIITKNISRFSRNTKELIDVVNQLKEIDVGIFFEKENIDTLKGYNNFLLSIYGALGQQEIENSSSSTRWGFEKRFIKGVPFFKKLLGYDVTDNRGNPEVSIIESEAKVVREIFDMYLKGSTLIEIARELMNQGIKTAYNGELWNTGNVKQILRNISYTGNKLTGNRTKDLLSKRYVSSDKHRTQYFR